MEFLYCAAEEEQRGFCCVSGAGVDFSFSSRDVEDETGCGVGVGY